MDSFLYAVGVATLIIAVSATIGWAIGMTHEVCEQARRLRVVEDALKVWEKSQ